MLLLATAIVHAGSSFETRLRSSGRGVGGRYRSLTHNARKRRLIGEGGGEERARVVVLRRAKQNPRCPALTPFAPPHHDDLARQRPHDPEIMGNEEISEVATPLQFAQQVNDLRLDRHVQSRRWLVE